MDYPFVPVTFFTFFFFPRGTCGTNIYLHLQDAAASFRTRKAQGNAKAEKRKSRKTERIQERHSIQDRFSTNENRLRVGDPRSPRNPSQVFVISSRTLSSRSSHRVDNVDETRGRRGERMSLSLAGSTHSDNRTDNESVTRFRRAPRKRIRALRRSAYPFIAVHRRRLHRSPAGRSEGCSEG